MPEYDAVVIGAGNGGLSAGAQLAASSVKVLILEQHNLPGGLATSFVRGRFEFEATLHELGNVGSRENKGGIRRLLEDGLGAKVDFVPVPEAFRLIITDEDLDVTMPFGVDAYLEAIEEAVPGSRSSVSEYLELCKEATVGTGHLFKSKGHIDETVLKSEYSKFLKCAGYSYEKVTSRLGLPDKARKILDAYWLYLAVPPSRMAFSVYGAMLYIFLLHGAYVPRFRSHELSVAMEKRIRDCGGAVEFNTRVDKILVENGRVVGVETAQGDRITTNHVICNASPTLAYNYLIHPKSEVPEVAYKNVNARIEGVSSFVVYLGLDASPEELGLSEYSYFIHDHMDLERLYASLSNLFNPQAQACICLNAAIPDCSPPGTTLLSLTGVYQLGVWETVKPENYVTIKRKVAEQFIDKFEKAMKTNVRDHIEEIEIATPQTFSRYTGAYKGNTYGYELETWDSIITRIMAMEEERYIKGVRFTGGSAFLGPGYNSTLSSGRAAAIQTLGDMEGDK